MAPPHPIRRLGRFTTNALMVLVILVCAAWLVPGLFGYERYVITGGSMSGTFEKGSIAFEQQVALADLRPGDIITYLPPADSGVPNLVTHRIKKIEPAEGGGVVYTTQGDANPDPDPWHFQLTGATQPVVRTTVPMVGYAFIALADRGARMLIIGGPAALVALFALQELAKALRDTRRTPASIAPGPAAG
jgi:signal peptidase I